MASPASAPLPFSLNRPQAYGLLAVIALIWGGNWVVLKLGLGLVGPYWLTALRVWFGLAAFIIILLPFRRLALPDRRDWPLIISTGFGQVFVFMLLINLGLRYVEAGRSSLLAYTTPLWVAPMAMIFLGERPGALACAGLAIGIAGLGVLFNPLGFDWSDRDVLIGNGLLLVSAMSWALTIIHARRHRWIGTPLDLAPWQVLVAAPLLTLLAAAVEPMPAWPWPPALWGILLYNGPLATALAFWCSLSVTRALPSVTSSLGLLAVPVVGTTLSVVLLGENLTLTNVSGLMLIISGLALLVAGEARTKA